VAVGAEVILPRHRVANAIQLIAVKLDQPIALLAMQMIVLGIAVVVLVNGPASQRHAAEQSGVHQLGERPIDGGPADAGIVFFGRQLRQQLIGVKMIVAVKDLVHNDPTLARGTLLSALKIFFKALFRRHGHFHVAQGKILFHALILAALRNLVQQPLQRQIELRIALINACGKLSANLRNAFLTDVRQLVGAGHQVRLARNAHLISAGNVTRVRFRAVNPRNVGRADRLGGMNVARSVDFHVSFPP